MKKVGCNINKEWNLISSYKELEDKNGWKRCKYCNEHPRVWSFNNGNFADCKCGEMYENTSVRYESIMSHVKRYNGSALNYDFDGLRIIWNEYVEKGIKYNLPKGLW